VTVDDSELLESLRFAIYRTKLLMEPTGCLAVAALLHGKVRGSKVAAVVSGGNLDLSLLSR
jgi:threo-3-hydroxy-L-aspartate ammonia-lyase